MTVLPARPANVRNNGCRRPTLVPLARIDPIRDHERVFLGDLEQLVDFSNGGCAIRVEKRSVDPGGSQHACCDGPAFPAVGLVLDYLEAGDLVRVLTCHVRKRVAGSVVDHDHFDIVG
jgi:hypothetical protein